MPLYRNPSSVFNFFGRNSNTTLQTVGKTLLTLAFFGFVFIKAFSGYLAKHELLARISIIGVCILGFGGFAVFMVMAIQYLGSQLGEASFGGQLKKVAFRVGVLLFVLLLISILFVLVQYLLHINP